MKRLKNYIGQLRLYSLADLILLLLAVKAAAPQFIGVILLHIPFLAYLESSHLHPYRAKMPRWIAYVIAIIGVVTYGRTEGLIYLFFSFLYTQKISKFGTLGPVFRGLQNLFIIAGIIGYNSSTPYIVGILFFLRNLAGDFRDTQKDKKEGMKTIPIVIGMKRNIRYIHLILMILTSVTWWSLSSIPAIWLLLVITIEVLTYNLTPR
jgi:1,4-dihydroxy-2-naphthoate octaprenyltransferase